LNIRGGIEASLKTDLKLRNVVFKFDFARNLHLDGRADLNHESELFPGYSGKLSFGNAKFTIFPSGKGYCSGVKSFADIDHLYEEIRDRFL